MSFLEGDLVYVLLDVRMYVCVCYKFLGTLIIGADQSENYFNCQRHIHTERERLVSNLCTKLRVSLYL